MTDSSVASTQAHPKRKRILRTPEVVQTRVIAKKLQGKSNRAIAREEGVDHHTVGRIVEDSEFREVIKSYRPEILELVPLSLKLFKKSVKAALGEEPIDPPADNSAPIAVLDRDDLKRQLDAAYKRGVAAGIDGMRAAADTLKGTQALVSKEEVAVDLHEGVRGMPQEQRDAEIAALLAKGRAKK